MPVISRFYGIMIAMNFMDHNPPHLHAKYAGFEALFDFSGELIESAFFRQYIKLLST